MASSGLLESICSRFCSASSRGRIWSVGSCRQRAHRGHRWLGRFEATVCGLAEAMKALDGKN